MELKTKGKKRMNEGSERREIKKGRKGGKERREGRATRVLKPHEVMLYIV